ncbi:MAG: hypothetical protein A2X34_03745 [Elusimicrobia bacterium GWC2_51_8]|nr:MAG: hypothetical protein A2X33_11085 [Elusimicrobia bacterium GWA2_51_34]OGR60374.1 MAG: hypothetical protein A2X34_03745 [Elusimicrobia bacterium GWC2_51_8]OGR86844.1 MAG: hypothetical protein A2021_04175 [Elusimicrobia bacterium GWF2_52_66]HAF95138.1 hypothetical protein [Elusimicrobiota bacterium]HCE99006.1 hypothetical protein [Elusimicrobiota bacterium]
MENIKGWAIDLKVVYGDSWEDREKFHLLEDLWESPDGKTAGLLYAIAEAGISKEFGRLAVFRNKKDPELVRNFPWLECWYLYDSAVQFGKDGFLFVHRFKFGRNVLGIKLCALNLDLGCYARIDCFPDKSYHVRHLRGREYEFMLRGEDTPAATVIDMNSLSWKPFKSVLQAWLAAFLLRLRRMF